MRMVLVDDDEALRRTSSHAFRQRGWDVTEAHDLRSAVDAALTTQPHIIVTELLLPDAREFHFVRALRSSVDNDVAIIGVTRLPAKEFARARLAGFKRPRRIEFVAALPRNAYNKVQTHLLRAQLGAA